jgi:hypothetical protein
MGADHGSHHHLPKWTEAQDMITLAYWQLFLYLLGAVALNDIANTVRTRAGDAAYYRLLASMLAIGFVLVVVILCTASATSPSAQVT